MFFSPLLYRLSYQATKSANYTQTVVELDKCADCVRSLYQCWAILRWVGVSHPADGEHRVEDGLSSVW